MVHARAHVPTPGILLSTEFWLVWGRIARREERAAAEARASWTAATDSTDESNGRSAELYAGLTAICAAAFSIEALVLTLTEQVMPQQVAAKWLSSDRPPAFEKRLLETSKQAIAQSGKQVDELVSRFHSVIEKRGHAVHNLSVLEPPVPHPAGGLSTLASRDYSAEEAADAVDRMSSIYRALVEAPKPKATVWVNMQQLGLRELAGMTGP